MLAWLADWLRGIIAVVLLASFIDLLLPNRSMQRYVRLVASLIILLTILSPIISLLRGDFNARLDRSFASWIDAPSAREVHMPTLQDIQRDAEAMRRKAQASAAALAERKLEEAMLSQIQRRTGTHVMEVAVELGEDAAGMGGAVIAKVSVTIAAPEDGQAEGREQSEEAVVAVVEPVAVAVQLDGIANDEGTGAALTEDSTLLKGELADRIVQVLQNGWDVEPESVLIRTRA
ncbi:stage III sporulation protein AF [Paenibacillus oenotherae]|uniref:Stage III sporulation protein AF n=1 Tax=Paenibacillus oenotherae TaxID=1435645 RepID=A0ABS7D2C3_9BACL|nr:stage III sporulation protein AF [Paenibacillus oenotherae]MBW7473556.1 stage III sporulation protein AF [Paenibacillus oenotherae]